MKAFLFSLTWNGLIVCWDLGNWMKVFLDFSKKHVTPPPQRIYLPRFSLPGWCRRPRSTACTRCSTPPPASPGKMEFWISGPNVAHTNLVIVISPGKSLEAIREKSPTGWVKLLPVVLRQLGAKGVDGDNECPGKICLLCNFIVSLPEGDYMQ